MSSVYSNDARRWRWHRISFTTRPAGVCLDASLGRSAAPGVSYRGVERADAARHATSSQLPAAAAAAAAAVVYGALAQSPINSTHSHAVRASYAGRTQRRDLGAQFTQYGLSVLVKKML